VSLGSPPDIRYMGELERDKQSAVDALNDFLDHADALKTFGLWRAFAARNRELLAQLAEEAAR
jgi:hypothetical protein